jgi:hypothetical protein
VLPHDQQHIVDDFLDVGVVACGTGQEAYQALVVPKIQLTDCAPVGAGDPAQQLAVTSVAEIARLLSLRRAWQAGFIRSLTLGG